MEVEVKKDWNTEAGLEKFEWLAENIKGLDQSVKEMLRLIEHDGEFAMEKGGSDHPKQLELIACVRDISHRHQLLADHYNKLMGELNNKAEDGIKSYEKTSFLTPGKQPGMLKTDNVNVLSDSSPSPGAVISDATQQEGSESSILSSDSDSESYNSSPNSHSEMEGLIIRGEQQHKHDSKKGECGECEMLLRQILDYKKELKASTGKLRFAEGEIAKLKSELQKNEAVIFNLASLEAELMAAKNHITLLDSEIEQENKTSLVLQRQIVDLEGKLDSAQLHVLELQGSVTKHKAELSDRDLMITKLNAELQNTIGKFASEKCKLESLISNLSQNLVLHEARTREMQMQCDYLTDQIMKYEAGKVEMEENQEALRIKWLADTEDLKSELCKKNMQVDALHETLEALKLKHDMLKAEKDGAETKLQTSNDRIKLLDQSLHEQHCENNLLSAEYDHKNKIIDELMSRIDELEIEVGMQTTKTNDVAEEKREAIRQLCFSLNHFRSAYEDMCNVYAPRRRAATMAS